MKYNHFQVHLTNAILCKDFIYNLWIFFEEMKMKAIYNKFKTFEMLDFIIVKDE